MSACVRARCYAPSVTRLELIAAIGKRFVELGMRDRAARYRQLWRLEREGKLNFQDAESVDEWAGRLRIAGFHAPYAVAVATPCPGCGRSDAIELVDKWPGAQLVSCGNCDEQWIVEATTK